MCMNIKVIVLLLEFYGSHQKINKHIIEKTITFFALHLKQIYNYFLWLLDGYIYINKNI